MQGLCPSQASVSLTCYVMGGGSPGWKTLGILCLPGPWTPVKETRLVRPGQRYFLGPERQHRGMGAVGGGSLGKLAAAWFPASPAGWPTGPSGST